MLFLNNRRKNKGKKNQGKGQKKNFYYNLFVTSYKGNKKKG